MKQKHVPLSEELASKRFYKRKKYTSPAEAARQQVYADWMETGFPVEEKKGVIAMGDLILKILPKLEFNTTELSREQLMERWKKAAGDFIAHNTELIAVKQNTAIIKVIQPTLRYHLAQWHGPLLERLKNEFPDFEITSMKFIYG